MQTRMPLHNSTNPKVEVQSLNQALCLYRTSAWLTVKCFKIDTFEQLQNIIANGRTTVPNKTDRPKFKTLKHRQTNLTGYQHRDHISNQQRVGRHPLPTLLCFNFFPTTQKKLKFYASRKNGTFAFARNTKPTHRKT